MSLVDRDRIVTRVELRSDLVLVGDERLDVLQHLDHEGMRDDDDAVDVTHDEVAGRHGTTVVVSAPRSRPVICQS